ncbi:MAG TPA: hypothetical protein VK939_07310 [Longimicrobiales bacterium]|nr:hypothetical protein [Longimicrobiales bacterium]
MKSSVLTVLAASSLLVLGACAADDDVDDLDSVQEIETPAPAPAPAPMPMDTMPMDTMPMDTMTPTTTPGM